MGKANTQQTSYTSGEVSPLLRGRPDTAKFQAGAETVENFIVRPQGPLWRRSGTKYIGPAISHGASDHGILIPFEFSSTEVYVLEFSHLKLKIRNQIGDAIYKNTLITINSAATSAGLVEVTTSAAHGLSTGTWVTILTSSVPAYNGEWAITVTAADKFKLDRSIFSATATAQAFEHVWLASPYGRNYLRALTFAQSADTMWICHKLHKIRTLTRTDAYTWAFTEFTTVDGPYLDADKTNTRMTVSALSDVAILDANATMAAGANKFAVGDVNSYVEYQDDGEFYLAKITAFTSASQVTVDIVDEVKVLIDPSVQLSPKASDTTFPTSRTLTPNATGPTPRPYTNPLYQPSRTTPGIAPNSSPPVTPKKENIDPNVKFGVGGLPTLTASHSNTFDLTDLNRYVRISVGTGWGAADSWRKITVFTNSYTVTLDAALTIKTYSSPTEVVTLRQNSRTISATLTASAATFASTDVGRHIRLNFQGRWVFAKITAYTSTTVVTITMYESFPRSLRNANRLANNGATDIWRFGAWYGEDGFGNYPSCVTFHEQRLVFAGSPLQPQTLWFSRPQDFNKMSPSEMDGLVADDNAINVTLASNKVNAIQWMQSMKVLLIGTLGGEWQARAATSITEPISPTNITITEETTHGSIDNFTPIKVGSAVLFIQRSGQKMMEMTYNWEIDGWGSRDLTIPSEHIFRVSTKGYKAAYQNQPNGIVWVLTGDFGASPPTGTLAAMTYARDQEVLAWHRHSIGGSAMIESICCTPSIANTGHVLQMIVRRTINSVTSRYIEVLTADHYPASVSDKNGFWYVDSGVTQTMTTTLSTWDAFAHLVGETVVVIKNGVSQGTKTVNASGQVTVSSVNGDVLTGGYAYTSKLKSLPVQGGSPYGSSDMTKKRVARLFLRLLNSINARVGRNESNLQTKTFAGAVGSETLYTGDVDLNTNLDYSTDGVFHVQCSDPYPLILLSTVAQLVANE